MSSASEFLTSKGIAFSVLASQHQQFERLPCGHLFKSDLSLWVRPSSASVQDGVPGVATSNDVDHTQGLGTSLSGCRTRFSRFFLFLWRFEQQSLFLFRVSVVAADFGAWCSFVSFVILCLWNQDQETISH